MDDPRWAVIIKPKSAKSDPTRLLPATQSIYAEASATGRVLTLDWQTSPADAALMMQRGGDGVFVGSGIFKSESPQRMAEAIVKATSHFRDPDILAEVSTGLGDAMPGLDVRNMPVEEQLAVRGW